MRIQVLNLPDELVDGQEVARFALVLDEYATGKVDADPDNHEVAKTFRTFAQTVGAKDGLVVDRSVEIVEGTATQETISQIVEQLDELISKRLDGHVAARAQFQFRQGGITADTLRSVADRQRPPREW